LPYFTAFVTFYIAMRLATPARRAATRTIVLDRSLEAFPLFRLSDSADEGAISYVVREPAPSLSSQPAVPPDEETDRDDGATEPESSTARRWRVLPAPGDRLPGTFDQDVYIELMHRFGESGWPSDGLITFTLHAFLRSIGRRVDGRTYEQLRGALGRLERTILESSGAYQVGGADEPASSMEGTFTVLASVTIERRRLTDREQLPLFGSLADSEPGDARVIIAPTIRANIAAGRTATISATQYQALASPVARRLYRLLAVARAEDRVAWRVPLERLASQLPLTQRYPSHLQRVLQPAHDMLIDAGILRNATFSQNSREWSVDYVLATRNQASA
jgi:plasmid replication initiation protein